MNPITRLEIYAAIALVLAFVVGAAYYKGYTAGEEKIQTKYDLFVAQVNAAGEKARADAAIKEKENADKVASAVASRDAALNSLRLASARARSGFVPAAPAGSADSNRVCYSRQALDAALRSLDTGVSRLLTEGDTQVINAATLLKAWPAAASKP